MAKDLTEPTIGHIVMPITWDGTNFHVLMSTEAGLLEVAVPGPVVCNMMGWDAGAPGWQAVQVDGAGHLQVDVTSIALDEIKIYAYDGGLWRWVTCDVAGHLQVDILSIADGQIKGYLWTGAAWAKVKGLASGIAQIDVDSLRTWADTIPMNYHDQWRARTSYVVDAGQDYVDSAIVPADHCAIVTTITAYTTSANTTQTGLYVKGNAMTTVLEREYAPVAYVAFIWKGHLYLKAGDYIQFDTTNCPIGQTVYLDVLGYYMRIA